jgi:hypothetical protein
MIARRVICGRLVACVVMQISDFISQRIGLVE